ncbi:MAG: sensor histidine kinase [Bellilinea sp.]
MVRTSSDADLAFAVVVLASYFATFSNLRMASPVEIILMIFLGIAYLAIGIYGYAYCARGNQPAMQLVYFLTQIALGAWIVYLGKGAGFNAMVLLPLAGHAVVLLPRRTSYLAQFGILIGYVGAVYAFAGSLRVVWEGLPIFFAGLVFIVAFTQMALSEETSRREVERLVGELTHANQQLREYSAQIEDLTIIKERNRLAREIHDGLGHYLTSINMQIQAADALAQVDNEKSKEHLMKAKTLTQEALADVRQSVGSLRVHVEENVPLTDLILKLFENSRTFGIEPKLEVIGLPREISSTVHWALYRAIQEAISNACKHSNAKTIHITLDYTSLEHLLLRVRDDGIGAINVKEGFGLLGLKERVNIVGGDFTIDTDNTNGFGFEIKVPC